jgi:hypothetical protein
MERVVRLYLHDDLPSVCRFGLFVLSVLFDGRGSRIPLKANSFGTTVAAVMIARRLLQLLRSRWVDLMEGLDHCGSLAT